MSRALSPGFENRVMDALAEYPHTAGDLSERLEHHVDRIRECLHGLWKRGLVEQTGKVRRHALWTLARTKRR